MRKNMKKTQIRRCPSPTPQQREELIRDRGGESELERERRGGERIEMRKVRRKERRASRDDRSGACEDGEQGEEQARERESLSKEESVFLRRMKRRARPSKEEIGQISEREGDGGERDREETATATEGRRSRDVIGERREREEQ